MGRPRAQRPAAPSNPPPRPAPAFPNPAGRHPPPAPRPQTRAPIPQSPRPPTEPRATRQTTRNPPSRPRPLPKEPAITSRPQSLPVNKATGTAQVPRATAPSRNQKRPMNRNRRFVQTPSSRRCTPIAEAKYTSSLGTDESKPTSPAAIQYKTIQRLQNRQDSRLAKPWTRSGLEAASPDAASSATPRTIPQAATIIAPAPSAGHGRLTSIRGFSIDLKTPKTLWTNTANRPKKS